MTQEDKQEDVYNVLAGFKNGSRLRRNKVQEFIKNLATILATPEENSQLVSNCPNTKESEKHIQYIPVSARSIQESPSCTWGP